MQFIILSLLQKAWILLPAGLVVFGLLYGFGKNPLRLRDFTSNKVHFWKGKKLLYLSVLVFLILSLQWNIRALPFSGTAVISLNYDGASSGMNPNSTRFNQADMLSDEILERVVRLGGYTDISAEDLKEVLEIEPVEKGASGEGNYRVSTEYKVHYEASRELAGEDCDAILQLFCGCYKEWFVDRFSYNLDALDADFETISREDYLDMCDYFDKTADRIHDFMSTMERKEPTFKSVSTGETFQTIGKMASNVKSSLVQDLRSYLLDQGIAKDSTTYQGRLTIENVFLAFDAQKYSFANENRLTAIQRYADDVARIVLIPTYDMDGQFYMSQTKIGIDNFAEDAEDFADQRIKVSTDIAGNDYIFGQLSQGTSAAAALQKADQMVETIEAELTAISSDAKTAVREYDETQANGYLSYTIPSKEDRIPDAVKEAVKETAAFLLTGLALALVVEIKQNRSRRTEAK